MKTSISHPIASQFRIAAALCVAALFAAVNAGPSNAQFVHVSAFSGDDVQQFLFSETGVQRLQRDGTVNDLTAKEAGMLLNVMMDDRVSFSQQSEEDDEGSNVVEDAINWLFDQLLGGDSSEQPTDGGGSGGDNTGVPEDDDSGNPFDDDDEFDLTDDEVDDMIQFWQPDRGFDRDGDDLIVRYFQSGRIERWEGDGGIFEEDARFDHCIHAPHVVDPNWGHETDDF